MIPRPIWKRPCYNLYLRVVYILIFISDIPQVHVISNSYTVNLGNTVSLQCVISADPIHTNVYWKKTVNSVSSYVNINSNNNKYGGATLSSPSLEIYNTVTSDEGFYVCYATNSVGTGHSSQTYLDVVGSKF